MLTTKIGTIILYILTLLVTLILNNKIRSRYKLFFVSLPLGFLAGFRIGSGIDYNTYRSIYNHISSITSWNIVFNYNMEPGNVFLFKTSDLIFGTHVGMFFLYGFLTTLFFMLGINNYKKDINFNIAIVIYFVISYFVSFNAMRQMLAASIVFYSFKYIRDRNLIKYIISVLISTLFHKSSIVALIFYFLNFKYYKDVFQFLYVTFILLLTLLLIFYPTPIISILKMINLYSGYIDSGRTNDKIGFLLYTIPIVTLILYYLYNSGDKKVLYLINIYLLSIPFQFLGNSIRFADRLALYSRGAEILIVSIIYKQFKNFKLERILIPSWYVFYFIVMIVILNSNGVIPYIQQIR